MAKDRERAGDTSPAGQSKRPPLTSNESDSQVSDHASQSGHHHHHRVKAKHHVGGGGRIHARVPSSKALHKHHNSSSTTVRPPRRQSSTSPDRASQPLSGPSSISHRRAVSDLKLTQISPSTHLPKNASHSSLKRNRSHADVVKRNKSATQLQSSNSSSGLNRLKSHKTQVHFALGTDDQEEEDEWVDASTSASPYISRRGSAVSSGQSSEKQTASNNNSRPQTPREPKVENQSATVPSPASIARERDRATANNLTSRLLKRTASYSAAPKMSPSTAMAGVRADSPDAGMQDSGSTLAGTPRLTSEVRSGSGSSGAMTSRFVTNDNASGSRLATAGSFYNPVPGQGPPRSTTDGGDESSQMRRPRSMGALSQVNAPGMSAGINTRHEEESSLTDDDEAGGITTKGRRRNKGYVVPPAELSRTQQKLNLERASSTMEPSHSHHQGPVAGALLGGAGYDSRDPRIGRLLERTGMEYLVVRRYQNPVTRSLARLAALPGQDKNRRIPNANGSTPPSRNGHTKRASEHGGGRFTLGGGSFRENDTRDIHSSGSQARRPATPRRAVSALAANGAGSSLDTDDGVGVLQDRLSGASLVNGEEDDGTLALLRNLWEKNLDPSASQD